MEQSSNNPKITCLNGIRCFCCLWIAFMHTHAFSAVFPWSSPSMTYIREFPILGFLSISTLAVDVFWLLSGFLCEYQLNYKVDKTKSFWFIWFFINRLLRLYPLYLLYMAMTVSSPMNFKCKSNSQIMKSIFFLEIFTSAKDERNVDDILELIPPPCSGAGWSLNTDVHGYIIIILLFIVFGNNKFKKYLLWCFYIISCILTVNIAFTYNITWPVMFFGLEQNDPVIMEKFFAKNPEFREQFPNALKFYPDYDVMTPQLIQYRERTLMWMYQLYFTSVTKHGAAIFLGSILAINVSDNKRKFGKLIWFNLIEIFISFIAFYLIMDLRMDTKYRSPLWTFVYDKLFMIGVFLFLDGILSIYQHDGNMIQKIIDNVFGNRVWNFLSKYTYGIYLFHIIPAVVIIMTTYPSDVENGGIGVDNYGFLYLGKVGSISFVLGFIISFVCYWCLEYPIMLFRNKYIKPRYVIEKIKKKLQ
eukprot:477976_1